MEAKDWKDTVMKPEEVAEIITSISNDPFRVFPFSAESVRITKAVHRQAEITWDAREPEIEQARKAGIKEIDEEFQISEQMEGMELLEGVPVWIIIDWHKWQAKLKEWEI